jgi:hypothetical protein
MTGTEHQLSVSEPPIIVSCDYCTGCGSHHYNGTRRRCCPDSEPVEVHRYVRHLEQRIDRMHPVIIAVLRTTDNNKWNPETCASELCPAIDAYREACRAL